MYAEAPLGAIYHYLLAIEVTGNEIWDILVRVGICMAYLYHNCTVSPYRHAPMSAPLDLDLLWTCLG